MSSEDLAVLIQCVGFVGGYEAQSFKTQLIGTLKQGYDSDRCGRIIHAIKNLSEEKILALCDSD